MLTRYRCCRLGGVSGFSPRAHHQRQNVLIPTQERCELGLPAEMAFFSRGRIIGTPGMSMLSP